MLSLVVDNRWQRYQSQNHYAMNIKEHVKFWLDGAEHDWDTAKSLFSTGKYDWCLFVAHLVLEKTLKALFIQDNCNQLPPKTHSLVKLARQTEIELTEKSRKFFLTRLMILIWRQDTLNIKMSFTKNALRSSPKIIFITLTR